MAVSAPPFDKFEWNEAKSIANKQKHGIEFIAAVYLFKGKVHSFPSRYTNDERYLAVGVLEGQFFTVVYTMRGDVVRIISARRSRDNEQRDYRKRFPEGSS